MGRVIANSTIAWPECGPPHHVGRWAPPWPPRPAGSAALAVGHGRVGTGRRPEGRTKPLISFSKVQWGGSAIQLQVGNDHPSEVGRSARYERVGVADQDQATRQGGVLRPGVV